MYDLAILGGGPAGIAAGVYAARKRLKTVLITEEIGGQSKVSFDIQNWIGTVSISGDDLAKSLKEHVLAYASDVLALKEHNLVDKVVKEGEKFIVTTNKGDQYESRAVLVTTGSRRRKLTVPGAEEYDGKGIVYCASCDGPLFADLDVVVIGGGNAGFETASQLTEYAKSVTLLEYNEAFKAEPVTVEKVLAHPKMTAVANAEVSAVHGEKTVTGISYKDRKTGEEKTLSVGGVFVEIGQIPNTEFVKDLVKTNEFGGIIIDPRTQQTSTPGIWAAGDNTDVLYHQNNIAAGDAVRAIEDIYRNLKTK